MDEREIIWTNLAINSFKEILQFYILQNKSHRFSQQVRRKIAQSVSLLSLYPFIGKPTEIKKLRELIIDRNSVFYKVTNDKIIILLIWDNRRNPDELFMLLNAT